MRTNQFIRAERVVLIDDTGASHGEVGIQEALNLARDRELDLVEVNPKAIPPVCRIVDFGKIQYEQAKKTRQSKANQKKVSVKGIRVGLHTDDHDLAFKRRQAEKFLARGNKVRLEIRLRGREKGQQGRAREALVDFAKTLDTPHKIEEDIKKLPNGFHMTITGA